MTEIWFYHLQTRPLEAALPGLVEKSLEKGWRVVIQAKSEERLDAIDSWLWTYADASFLAHGRARDGDAERQPVYLSTSLENPNGAEVRLFVEGAEIAPALSDPCAAPYVRAILMFDGNDEEELALARAQWKALKEKDLPLAYWRQDENGRWEQKA